MITQEQVNAKLRYDPATGFLYRRSTGKRAGCIRTDKRGWQISFKNKLHLSHRLIWFMMTGKWPVEIDHIDRDPLNNSWTNLREATRQQNCGNMTSRSKSGYKGVYEYRCRFKRGFVAMLKVNGKTKNLGAFPTAEAASAAYWSAAKAVFGKFATRK